MTPEQEELAALGFKIPDSITPIVACRSWSIHEGKLLSHNHTVWTPGQAMKAICRCRDVSYMIQYHADLIARRANTAEKYSDRPEECPVFVCTCGFYAAKPEDANHIVPCHPGYIHGEVYLWGKVVEGHNGYRAEYAYPKRFFANSEEQKLRLEAMEFGVPVVLVGKGDVRIHSGFPFPPGSFPRRKVVMHQLTPSTIAPLLTWTTVPNSWSSGHIRTGYVTGNQSTVSVTYTGGWASGNWTWGVPQLPPNEDRKDV